MKVFLNSLKNQLNLLFEILKTIFLNLNVPSFQVTIADELRHYGDRDGGLTCHREGFSYF